MQFKYVVRSREDVGKRANQTGYDTVGFVLPKYPFYKPQPNNYIRILPPTWKEPVNNTVDKSIWIALSDQASSGPKWRDARHYGMDVSVHYNIGPNNASVLCLAKMKGQYCPVCAAQEAAAKLGDEQASYALRAVKRVLVWVVDKDHEERGPLVYPLPWTLDRDIASVSQDIRTGEVYLIDHPTEGYDVSFSRTGEKRNVKYVGVQIARKATSVNPEHLEFVGKYPLPGILWWRTAEEITALMGAPAPVSSDSEAAGEAEEIPGNFSREDMFADPLGSPVPVEGAISAPDDEVPFDIQETMPKAAPEAVVTGKPTISKPSTSDKAAALRARLLNK